LLRGSEFDECGDTSFETFEGDVDVFFCKADGFFFN
jgi:hypothetical protein